MHAVLLHNIRSAYNVGSIFRTADAAGISHIFLSGYTPRPVDRFGRVHGEILKTALGAQTSLPWKYRKTPAAFVSEWRHKGGRVVGVEQDARANDYQTFRANVPTLFIFGNEVRGLSKALRDSCDEILEIPMRGKKESLNVAVAAGIVLFSCIYY